MVQHLQKLQGPHWRPNERKRIGRHQHAMQRFLISNEIKFLI